MTQFIDRNKKNIIAFCLIFLFSITFTPAISNAEGTILDTLVGTGKKCNYVDKGLYMPYSTISESFPIFGKLVNEGCVSVKTQVVDMFVTGFKVFLGLVSIFAVVNISIAGIQYMVQEKDTAKLRGAKKRLTQSVVGLILAFSGVLILTTVNGRLSNVGFDLTAGRLGTLVQEGAAGVANLQAIEGTCFTGECKPSTPGTGGAADGSTSGSTGAAAGTGDVAGARKAGTPTIFGYKDGDGTVGTTGDNGLGNGSWSPVSGWTYYNGGAHNPTGDASKYSQGVAVPRSTLISDFGSAENVKNGAYEIFVGGRSIGAFPVVDDSAKNLDLTYGLVKSHIDPSVTSSNSWSGAGKDITYKPLPNYWTTHTRPAQPMVRDSFSGTPNASAVDAAIQNPGNFKYQ